MDKISGHSCLAHLISRAIFQLQLIRYDLTTGSSLSDCSPQRQQDDSADHSQPKVKQTVRVRVPVSYGDRPESATNQATDDRATDAEECSSEATHRIAPRHESTGNRSDDKSDYQRADDRCEHWVLLMFARS